MGHRVLTAPSNANTSGLEVVAKVVSAHGDPEAFGEREIEVVADLSRIPYRTDLVTAASAQARIAELEAEVKKLRTIMKGREELATGLSLNMNALAHDVASDMSDRATAAEARADRLAKALEEIRDADPYHVSHPIARAALQQETQP